MSFGLTRQFSISIYVIVLSDSTLTNNELINLFCQLSDSCIVLLEDVDVNTFAASKLTKISRSKHRSHVVKDNIETEKCEGISLSELLNVIDEIMFSENVTLIMTMNHREKLDDALVRPGRIDLTIEFGLLGRQELRDLFVRMYSNEAESSQKSSVDVTQIVAGTPRQTDTTLTELHVMAEEFAARLPEHTLSGAEVQGLLLEKKLDPQGALAIMDDWLKKVLTAKDKQKSRNTAEDGTNSSDTKEKGVNNV